MVRRVFGVVVALGVIFASGLGAALGQAAGTYFEFGTVVALGRGTVEVQTMDAARGRVVQHSFALTRESRVDLVHMGDKVEVIFSAVPTATGEFALKRLVALGDGIPNAGPPPGGMKVAEAGPVAAVNLPGAAAGRRVPTAGAVGMPAAGSAGKGKQPKVAAVAPLSAGGGLAKTVPGASNVALGGVTEKRVPGASSVGLGTVGANGELNAPKTRSVATARPAEECNRSSAEWPTLPVSLAVLDFRYPTEREEAHDVTTTGGGSGTAVADLVYTRLDEANQFALSRGDRTKLYRGDFAGAARVGRQMGADAVLAGTFLPVMPDGPAVIDGIAVQPKGYELRAGVVDTCTGQLLMQVTSESCDSAPAPGLNAGAGTCKKYMVTPKQAAAPERDPGAFKAPMDAMLFVLEHNGAAVAGAGTAAGTVGQITAVGNGAVTMRLPAGWRAKAGDTLAIHARRLAKNPTTYTLQNLQDEEIGRVQVMSAQGTTVTGGFTGDYTPVVGDTVVQVQ